MCNAFRFTSIAYSLISAHANSFTPPVQLHDCGPRLATQQWKRGKNGSVYTLDVVGHTGYCLNVVPTRASKPKAGTQVYSANCGGTTTSSGGGTRDPPTAAEFWEIVGDNIVSKDPNASSLCFGVQPPHAGGPMGGNSGSLVDCSSADAQFQFGMRGSDAGTIVHKSSGLCLTVGRCAAPPPPLPPGASPKGTHPCDIYDSTGNPCVAAHSMVRALYSAYAGPLYSVRRSSDNETLAIPVLETGGMANSAMQDGFCAGHDCVVDRIFDQSPRANHLGIFSKDTGVNASADKHAVAGHPVYSAYFNLPGMGYRNINTTSGIALGEEPESMYMVTSGKHYNNRCCFDYGNAESDAHDDGDGTMEAIYFGNDETWWRERPANKTGPWIMADIENGMYAGDDNIDPDAVPTWHIDYVTAMLKGRVCEMSLKGGNAQQGALTTLYDGVRPQHNLYNPMRKQGGLILGTGGDNSNGAVGTFFEGAIASGYVSAATEEAIQANIVAAGYGRPSESISHPVMFI
eukprot:TRINITY_DN22230_c0_g1_i1.p1 TRINITY_DN22230_c0_g1~~TRINITY_DN22230_c0_g1_i1.p1  ORF type:complete len:516 (-),score=59.96 TRINITY_DN22230_c0_g1_i1:58-1605(-)